MKLRTALELGRVSNLPTVWTNVLAATILAGQPPAAGMMLLLIAAMSCFYVGGMYLNDLFDREIDARERPERPIPSGRASPRAVGWIGAGSLVVGLVLVGVAAKLSAASSPLPALGAGAALGVAIVLYDVRHKRNPWAPWVMGLCRALVYLTTALALTATIPATVWLGATVAWCYLIGLTYVARQENLARVTQAWPLALLAAPFVYAAPALGEPWVAALWLSFLAWVGHALNHLRRSSSRFHIPSAVTALIAGIALLDGLLIAHMGAAITSLWAVAGFVATRLLQRQIAGT